MKKKGIILALLGSSALVITIISSCSKAPSINLDQYKGVYVGQFVFDSDNYDYSSGCNDTVIVTVDQAAGTITCTDYHGYMKGRTTKVLGNGNLLISKDINGGTLGQYGLFVTFTDTIASSSTYNGTNTAKFNNYFRGTKTSLPTTGIVPASKLGMFKGTYAVAVSTYDYQDYYGYTLEDTQHDSFRIKIDTVYNTIRLYGGDFDTIVGTICGNSITFGQTQLPSNSYTPYYGTGSLYGDGSVGSQLELELLSTGNGNTKIEASGNKSHY